MDQVREKLRGQAGSEIELEVERKKVVVNPVKSEVKEAIQNIADEFKEMCYTGNKQLLTTINFEP